VFYIWTNSFVVMHNLLVEMCCICCYCCRVRVDYSIIHETNPSHEPFCNVFCTCSDWSVSAICVILPCMLWLPHPSGLLHQKVCMSSVLCVPSWVWIDPFQLGTHHQPHLNPPMLEPLIHLPWLTTMVTLLLLTELSYLPLWNIAVKALP